MKNLDDLQRASIVAWLEDETKIRAKNLKNLHKSKASLQEIKKATFRFFAFKYVCSITKKFNRNNNVKLIRKKNDKTNFVDRTKI